MSESPRRAITTPRTLTFSVDEVRRMLIAAWFADTPRSLGFAQEEADFIVQAEWRHQNAHLLAAQMPWPEED